MKIRPTVKGGKASRMSAETMSAIQVKSGIRMNVIPGALMLRIVTRKFSPPAIDPTPEIRSAST